MKKWRDVAARRAAAGIALWLRDCMGLRVYINEEDDKWDLVETCIEALRAHASEIGGLAMTETARRAVSQMPKGTSPSITKYDPSRHAKLVDLVVCLGGDGTVLHCGRMFQGPVPPVLSVAFGSLGFMTAFDMQKARHKLRRILDGEVVDALPESVRGRGRGMNSPGGGGTPGGGSDTPDSPSRSGSKGS